MDPPMCKVCNKFFGSEKFDNMCSKCFQQSQTSKRNLDSVQEIASKVPQLIEETKEMPAANPDRCAFCSRKLNLLPFRCKCSLYFCAKHRQPEQHNCTFDFKAVGIRKLSEENPLVQAEKLNRL